MTFPHLPAATAVPVPWKCHIDGPPFNAALKANFSPASLKIIKSLRAEWWERERLARSCLSHHAVVLQVWGRLQLQLSALTFTPYCSGPQEKPDFDSDALCSVALMGDLAGMGPVDYAPCLFYLIPKTADDFWNLGQPIMRCFHLLPRVSALFCGTVSVCLNGVKEQLNTDD